MRFTTKKIEVFAVHARTPRPVANLRDVFDAYRALPARERVRQDAQKLVAVPRVRVGTSDCYFAVYEGPVGMQPLIFNARDSAERIEALADAEVLATKTHVLIDLPGKEALIEFNQRGARAKDVAEAIVQPLRKISRWTNLDLHFQPVAGREFFEALEQFNRVRVATVQLARPNYDWTDHHDHLSEMASETDAYRLEVTATASRGGALSKRHGLVHFIRQLTEHRRNAVAQAKITGQRAGEPSETTVTLEKFVEQRRVRVSLNEAGHVDSADIRNRLLDIMEERRRDRRAE